ncbi:cytochrome P450 monooxygenase pc-3 [Coniophora puteana RWD-64-598 SS2]|uniref:Cytochrome P450 monooxygenase pc-3 n=1 Tax=Coniophora puteana (strain RWD-64-598) TaxID=741705 RepID=A0A5M3MZP5_CONPW|nr:cytochrome P450 monooxygenase pc-3 [Coniophora puteana RWD-64-598 SS2]EIW84467.1 cytochrome P450 monooxygenase pc-3 [Coniophora puteana RWD-64-598 SS2]
MKLTPGFRLLSNWVLNTLAPCIALAIAAYYFGVLSILPVWQTLLLAAATPPSAFLLGVAYDTLSQRRRAAALGARLVPRVKGRWPGNMDVVIEQAEEVDRDYMGSYFLKLEQKYGKVYNVRYLWDDFIFTTEPSHIKAILASNFGSFVKGEEFNDIFRSVLGTGVFNSDGDMWKFHRSMTRPFFTHDRISHFDTFDTHAETAITAAKDRFRAGHAIDFQDLISRFTLDSATEFLFGSCAHTLHSPLPYPYNAVHTHSPGGLSANGKPNAADILSTAFASAQTSVGRRTNLLGIWPLWEIFKDRTEDDMKVVHEFLEPIIAEAIEKQRVDGLDAGEEKSSGTEKAEVHEGETLLDHLVRLTTDRVILRDEVLNIMIAGRDTTASALTSAVYLLAMYPSAMDRLREEVMSKVGSSRRPTYDDLRNMKYLRAVLNETLRLFPPVPMNLRQTTEDTTLPSPDPERMPLFIPKNTMITYSVALMHRRHDLWGPDADEFDPDRFLDQRLQKYLVPNPFIFLPFNAGPRICLGQQFAYNEMSFMLVRLMQNFSRFELALDALSPDARPPAHWKDIPGRAPIEKFHPRSHLTLYAKGGMWVRMIESEQA